MCSQHWDQIVCMTNLTHPLGVYYSRNCHVACLTGLSRSTQTHCCFMLLMLQAARNNKTKVSPPSTRCSSTQLFHTLISWHVNMYCIYEAACERSLESPVPQALTSVHFCILFSPQNGFRKGRSDPTSVPVRRTTYFPRVWQYVACT